LAGHYGPEPTFDATVHNVSASTGRYDGTTNACPYIKDSIYKRGTVYVVSGSAGQLGGRSEGFPHNAMQYSTDSIGGASIIEVQENRLDLKWICSDGVIRDQFTIMKDVNRSTKIKSKKGQPLTLTASFIGSYQWNKKGQTGRTITVTPVAKKTTYEVRDPFNCIKDVFEVVTD
jgi:hypothetical protein